MEQMEQTLTGKPDFSGRITSLVARNGDLLHKGFVKLDLPELATTTGTVAWTNDIGHVILEEMSVDIGGATIDRITSQWLTVNADLTLPKEKEEAYQIMIGQTKALTFPKATIPAATLYVPLIFWFNKHVGTSLPLISLMYHDVKLNFQLRNVWDCIIFQGGATRATLGSTPSLRNVSLYLEYIFLDSAERRMFSQLSHEYLIEQVQYQGSETATGGSVKVKLSFSHPSKYIVWVVQPTENLAANRHVDFSYKPTADGYDGSEPMRDAKIQLNATDRTTTLPAGYWNLVQPFYYFKSQPRAGTYVYSWALKPLEHQPSGSINMSRIEGVNIVMTLNTATGESVTISPYCVNYNVLNSRHIKRASSASVVQATTRHNQIAGNSQRHVHPLRRGNAREDPGERPVTMGTSHTAGTIRRQAPKPLRHGEASTTRRLWVRRISRAGLRYSLCPVKYAVRRGSNQKDYEWDGGYNARYGFSASKSDQ
jgi:hypothetical protein